MPQEGEAVGGDPRRDIIIIKNCAQSHKHSNLSNKNSNEGE